MKRNTILNVSVAVAVFCTAAIGAMSFKTTEKTKAGAATIYEYNSSNTAEGEFAKPANWVVVAATPSCNSFGNRPCSITVADGSSLSAVIGGKNNAQVLAIHPSQRKP